MDYIGHQVSFAGLEAHPKDLGSLVNIPFPRTLRSMQSFLGSLNYYSRFIEDFAIYASVLYELREADFHEIRRMDEAESSTRNGKRADDRKCLGDHDPNRNSVTGGVPKFFGASRGDPNRNGVRGDDPTFFSAAGGDANRNSVTGGNTTFSSVAGGDPNRNSTTGGDPTYYSVAGGYPTCKDRSRWERAMISFTMLKDKIAKTPILKIFDPNRPPVIVVYASKWAVSAALLQEHDGVYWSVTLTI